MLLARETIGAKQCATTPILVRGGGGGRGVLRSAPLSREICWLCEDLIKTIGRCGLSFIDLVQVGEKIGKACWSAGRFPFSPSGETLLGIPSGHLFYPTHCKSPKKLSEIITLIGPKAGPPCRPWAGIGGATCGEKGKKSPGKGVE